MLIRVCIYVCSLFWSLIDDLDTIDWKAQIHIKKIGIEMIMLL